MKSTCNSFTGVVKQQLDYWNKNKTNTSIIRYFKFSWWWRWQVWFSGLWHGVVLNYCGFSELLVTTHKTVQHHNPDNHDWQHYACMLGMGVHETVWVCCWTLRYFIFWSQYCGNTIFARVPCVLFPKISMKIGVHILTQGFLDTAPLSDLTVSSQLVQECQYLTCIVIHVHARNFWKLALHSTSVTWIRIHTAYL